jgi:hypothetical protein
MDDNDVFRRMNTAYVGVANATAALRSIRDAYVSGRMTDTCKSKVNYTLLTLLIRLLEAIDLWSTVHGDWYPDPDIMRDDIPF